MRSLQGTRTDGALGGTGAAALDPSYLSGVFGGRWSGATGPGARRIRGDTNSVNSSPSFRSRIVCSLLYIYIYFYIYFTVADCCARCINLSMETDGQSRTSVNVNDPSAGSPTETLLRLLLPLNDQVWSSSRQHRQCRDIAAHQSEDLTKSFNR